MTYRVIHYAGLPGFAEVIWDETVPDADSAADAIRVIAHYAARSWPIETADDGSASCHRPETKDGTIAYIQTCGGSADVPAVVRVSITTHKGTGRISWPADWRPVGYTCGSIKFSNGHVYSTHCVHGRTYVRRETKELKTWAGKPETWTPEPGNLSPWWGCSPRINRMFGSSGDDPAVRLDEVDSDGTWRCA